MAIRLFSHGIAAFNAPTPETSRFRMTGEFELPPEMETPTSDKVRQVLALLLLRSGQFVTTDDIRYELWEDKVRTARTTTHTYVMWVRKALKDDTRAKEKQLIRRVPTGYRVNIDPREVDILRFVDSLKYISVEPESDEASLRSALSKLEAALSLIRGPVLEDIEHGRTLTNLVQRFDEYICAAHTMRFEVALMLGMHQRVSGELFEVYMDNLGDENIARLLMLALYRCNRRQDALKIYRELRKVLRDEFGVEPSPQIETLHTRILSSNAELVQNFRSLG